MKYSDKQKTVSITRSFDLPLSLVWEAWTEPETFKKWWGPEGYSCPSCSIDLSVEGKYLFCMRSEEGDDFWSAGNYVEIIPKEKLVFTDNFSDENGKVIPASKHKMPGKWPRELLITINLEENAGRTTMVFQHEGLPVEVYDDCMASWQQSFDKLEKNVN